MKHFLLILTSLFCTIIYSQDLIVYNQKFNTNEFWDLRNDYQMGYVKFNDSKKISELYDPDNLILYCGTNNLTEKKEIYYVDNTRRAYIVPLNKENKILYYNNDNNLIGYLKMRPAEDTIIADVFNNDNKILTYFSYSNNFDFKNNLNIDSILLLGYINISLNSN